MKNLFTLLSLFLLLSACRQQTENDIHLIPLPQEIEIGKASFIWNPDSKIVLTSDNMEMKAIADYCSEAIAHYIARETAIEPGTLQSANSLILCLDNSISGNETYQLTSDKNRIVISASTPVGLFYGVQTFLQLLSTAENDAAQRAIPELKITDSPRFAYRGMHLDVSRHFFSVDEVKKYIDLLALFKFNYFHWHLTDGAGWRIEIKKHPLLTRKTAFRPYNNWKEWRHNPIYVDEGHPSGKGGYYTQEEIKEVIDYAAERYITIIPEIETPSHSEEVLVAYPHLSCSGKPYMNGELCIGNEDSFSFFEDVLSEVIELFPSEYIHIGGDEANKSAWRACAKCQKRARENNLNNTDELQIYFIDRLAAFVKSKHRKIIGWDEILEGELPDNAVAMVWRSEDFALKAARQQRPIIMAPGSHCYFDFYQSDPTTEPEAIGGYLPLRKVYSFEPVANDSLQPYVLGGQANLWAEYISDFKKVEYMVFPRAIALSEVLWSPKEKRDWESFKLRLPERLKQLDAWDVNYHKPSYLIELQEQVDRQNKRIEVTFETEQSNPEIRYTTDGTMPTAQSTRYKGKFFVDETILVNAAIFVNGNPQQPHLSKKTGYHKAIGKKVIYNTMWDKYPAGGETALVDGKRGGFNYSDQLWQGFTSDMDVIIDLGELMDLHTVNVNFMQLIGPEVYMPGYVEVSFSTDGSSYERTVRIDNDVPVDYERLYIKDFSCELDDLSAHYVRVFAKNNKEFIFADEIVID